MITQISPYDFTFNALLPIILSALLGGLVGTERERYRKAAGLRTHILVCMGACLASLTSIYLCAGAPLASVTRIPAQIVSGVGFLGAGIILKSGESVTGLTTAASLWVVANIGMAVGLGFDLGAVAATFILLTVLIVLGRIEHANRNNKKPEIIQEAEKI